MLASIETCDDCDVRPIPTPVAAQRWAVELLHEHHCPCHDDHLPSVPNAPANPTE